MAVNKYNIIVLALILGIAVNAAENNLTQLDLKKSSDNSVDVTLFTSNGYNDNVLVRKKSDNKYVILVPKVQSSGFSNSSLNGVKDLVSNLDVKTVNDTSGGYTKITLITTKPLDIKTHSQKSAPVTEEQKEYKTLMAQANSIKNNINSASQRPQKTEVTVNKAQPEKVAETKKEIKKAGEQIKNNAPSIKLTEIDPEKEARLNRKQHLAELIAEERQETALSEIPKTSPEKSPEVKPQLEEVQELVSVQKTSMFSLAKHKIASGLRKIKHSKLPNVLGIVLIPVLALMMFAKFIKNSLAKSTDLKTSFIENLPPRASTVDAVKYNNIANNNELNWQEKYKQYLGESAQPVSRGENKGNYTFIKRPKEADEITKKRVQLEKLVENIQNQAEIEPEIVEIQSEDDVITNTIKFKAFDNRKNSLKISSRDKSRFKKYEKEIPLNEQKNVELGSSLLHTNPRSFRDGNLSLSDVNVSRLRFRPYVMSSVDEYFSILDKEEAKSVKKQAQPENRNSDFPSIEMKKSQTNPIANRSDKSNYVNNLIIKSGYDIDKSKGFYVVNNDGQNALIGKIKDEVFVLKKFDKSIDKPIQVRHDNANVYMVKAGNFKSLIEVNDNKMGVLIEL